MTFQLLKKGLISEVHFLLQVYVNVYTKPVNILLQLLQFLNGLSYVCGTETHNCVLLVMQEWACCALFQKINGLYVCIMIFRMQRYFILYLVF